MHQLQPEQPEYTATDDTFYVDGIELIDVDTVNPWAEDRGEGFVALQVHNKPIEIKVDAGAKCNVISKDTFQQLSKGQIAKCSKTTTLVAYRGSQGLVTLSPHVHQINTATNEDFTKDIFEQYKDVFSDELGELPIAYSMTLHPAVQPVVRPAHRIPLAMQEQVKAELNSMTHRGVITTVSEPTDWVSSMVVTLKKDKQEIQLCINPKDLNTALKRPHYPMRSVEEVATQMSGAALFSMLDA